MVHVVSSSPAASYTGHNGPRPVNLRTDLAALADLIEMVFAETMDNSGRAALREMRMLSRMGPGVRVLAQLNEMAQGVGLGYVWVEDGHIVGNVSIYPSAWPQSLGQTFVIANVGVHPDYRGHGIARHLMKLSMDMIARKDGARAILQVDANNYRARPLYRELGFVEDRTFTAWRRSSYGQVPAPPDVNAFIRRRRRSEWKRELARAEFIRPDDRGGLGWMRPLHPAYFRRGFWASVGDFINLRGYERLVAVDADGATQGSIWMETAFGMSARLTLLIESGARGIYDDLLLNNIVRRYGRGVLTCEHPDDDVVTSDVLVRYRFARQRTVVHMRWEVPPKG